MGKRPGDVVVVDAERQYVGRAEPGLVRALIRARQATVLYKSPFTVKLAAGLREIPSWNAVRTTMETTPQGPSNVTILNPVQEASARLSARKLGFSWQEYFTNRPDGECWVQNLTDMQISLDVEVAPNQTQSKLLPPTPDPVNLTEDYPFEILKKSSNFRKALAKRRNGRPDFILLDAVQVEAYYKAKARHLNLVNPDGTEDIDRALEAAANTRRMLTTREVDGENISPQNAFNFSPPKSAQELIAIDLAARGVQTDGGIASNRYQAGGQRINGSQIMMQEVINPRVLHLCQQVSPQVPEGQRMSFDAFKGTIEAMSPNLRIEDWQHIEAHGNWRAVKKMARERIAALAGSEEDPEPAGALSFSGHRLVQQANQRGAMNEHVQGYNPNAPASLGQQGQYQGPTGFANAPIGEMYGRAESMAASGILGPDGQPLNG